MSHFASENKSIEFVKIFYGNPTRNKKVRGKNTLPEYHKTHFDSKLAF